MVVPPGSEGDFLFLPLALGGLAAFLEADSTREASISSLDRLGFRMRPARLNRAQWLSIASVRLGFLELAIFSALALSRRSCSAGSSFSGSSRSISGGLGLALGAIVENPPLGMGSMGVRCEGVGATDVGREGGAVVGGAGDIRWGVAIGVEGARPLPRPRAPPLAFPLPIPLPRPRPLPRVDEGVEATGEIGVS